MKRFTAQLKNIERANALYAALVLCCSLCVIVFLSWYFSAYHQPYMAKEIRELSEGWRYDAHDVTGQSLPTLHTGPRLAAGETMTMYRTLDTEYPGASILIRSNHQSVNVYLDDTPLHIAPTLERGENPGMELHFIPLPENYAGKTLKIELVSPYTLYAGRTSPVLIGTIPSLEAYAISRSMRSVMMMVLCLFLGFCVLALTLIQTLHASFEPQYLFLGIFAVVLGLYYVCTDYIVYQFFPPLMVSNLSLVFYYSLQAPLALYFYFSFTHYRKLMLPAAILHSGFSVTAIVLQLAGLMDLPRLVNINNILLVGLAYTIILAVLEAFKKNRMMMLAAPFFILAYISMLANFSVFYNRSGVVLYSYRDTYFLLVLCILIFNIRRFFSGYYRSLREGEILAVQNRQAKESYERMKTHINEIGGLKHEMKNHFAALQLYLNGGQYEDAKAYLSKYTGYAFPITEKVYHEHYLINAVISHTVEKASELGVNFESDFRVEQINITEPDLYSLFSNILDNALEAQLAVPEGRRLIRLTLTRREPYVCISCVNSRAGVIKDLNGRLKSTKTGSGHGYGLWIVEQIAERHRGFMDIEYDERMFTITVVLKD